jgi:hypothetical protein
VEREMKKSANEGERGIKEWKKAVLWIRIRIRFHFGRLDLDPNPHWESGSGFRRAKMTHKSEENSSFDVLDVLF